MKKNLWIHAIIVVMLMLLPSVSLAEEQEPSGAAAEAAQALRLISSESVVAESLEFDWTGNSTLDEADVKALLLSATGLLDSREALQDALENSMIGEQHLELFSYGEPQYGAYGSYRSDLISVSVQRVETEIEESDVVYFLADIYVRDLNCLRTAVSDGYDQMVVDMAEEHDAVLAISGDYFRGMSKGLVIRNGEVLRKSLNDKRDICVLYADGVMETYAAKTMDRGTILARGPWQAWCFGPALLDEEGQTKVKFNSNVHGMNPRAAIGYYSPGHYCFLLVDGRQEDYSVGMTLKQLSQLFYDLGCKAAFNLDGGATAVLATPEDEINQRPKKNRGCSDMIYLSDQRENWTVDVKDFLVESDVAAEDVGAAAGDPAAEPTPAMDDQTAGIAEQPEQTGNS